MQYTIKNERLQITVSDCGGELVSVLHDGKERLWQNETGVWSGRAPLLFPIAGHVGVKIDGISYPMKAHGFCKRTLFTLKESGEKFLSLSLVITDEMRKMYPYDFAFTITYRIDGATLTVENTVENLGDTTLYFANGAHESYALESGDMGNYEVRFEKTEEPVHYVHDIEGYLTGETVRFPDCDRFVLPDEMLQNDDTIIFGNIRSRKVWLCEKDGKELAEISFDQEYSNLLLWRAENSPRFICVEPWTILPDVVGAPEVEFSQKAGVLSVDGKSKKTLTHTVEYK